MVNPAARLLDLGELGAIPVGSHKLKESTMLVLSRKIRERIIINGNIVVSVDRIKGNRVSIGIVAPPEVPVVRGELQESGGHPKHPNHPEEGNSEC